MTLKERALAVQNDVNGKLLIKRIHREYLLKAGTQNMALLILKGTVFATAFNLPAMASKIGPAGPVCRQRLQAVQACTFR